MQPVEIVEVVKEEVRVDPFAFNCFIYAEYLMGIKFPRQATMLPNTHAAEGVLALFKYSDGTPHMGVIQSIGTSTFIIKESNYKKGRYGVREVSFSDPFLQGFWLPQNAQNSGVVAGKESFYSKIETIDPITGIRSYVEIIRPSSDG